tara:strand:- start:101 stop:715 length:615 start_codon:yes stop_codon:yes gene_type:complete
MTDKLIFFDFDYTLARTTENVMVWSPRGTSKFKGRKYTPLSAREYNIMEIADDEVIDEESYTQFKKVNINKAKPIDSVLLLLNTYFNKDNCVKVLSARPQEAGDDVLSFLKKQGIIKTHLIEYKGCQSSSPALKFHYICECVKKYNPSEVILFDDSKKVIQFVEKNFLAFNVKLTTCLVEILGNEEILRFKKVKNKKKLKKEML